VVRKFREGIYVLMTIEGAGTVIHELERRPARDRAGHQVPHRPHRRGAESGWIKSRRFAIPRRRPAHSPRWWRKKRRRRPSRHTADVPTRQFREKWFNWPDHSFDDHRPLIYKEHLYD